MRVPFFSIFLEFGKSSTRDQVIVGMGNPDVKQSNLTSSPGNTNTTSDDTLTNDGGAASFSYVF